MGKKGKKSSSKPTPRREGYKADEAWYKKAGPAEGEPGQEGQRNEPRFQNVSKSLEMISQGLNQLQKGLSSEVNNVPLIIDGWFSLGENLLADGSSS